MDELPDNESDSSAAETSLPEPVRNSKDMKAHPPPTASACPQPAAYFPTKQLDNRLFLPVGTHVLFRSEDCGRWARELLDGTVLYYDDGVRANTDSAFYYRVLWLRGVEVLANGFYRASLVLTEPSGLYDSKEAGCGFWPQEIGLFPSQLAAFRAVITAEKIGRMKFRRELVSGRFIAEEFPSESVLDEILEETEAILDQEFAVRITRQDDLPFITAAGKGTWSYRHWMKTIGREHDLREEDAVTADTSSGLMQASMPWRPADRIRYFLVEQNDLCFPELERRHHLQTIVKQLLLVYMGFNWSKWQAFVRQHRQEELEKQQCDAAHRLQTWIRRLQRQRRDQEIAEYRKRHGLDSLTPLQALELYHRRQQEAVKLYKFMNDQYRAKQRAALALWAANANVYDPSVRRHFEITEQKEWHPSHGIQSLPRLPVIYAHKRSDGSLAIEDMKKYKQFRANHAGPTDVSYWIIRARVLAGVYPIGRSFREARRIVARADYTTSVLLQNISVFVCLATEEELREFEKGSDTSESLPNTPAIKAGKPMPLVEATRPRFQYEQLVRNKHDELRVEFAAALKMNLRHAQLAQSEMEETQLQLEAAIAAQAVATTVHSYGLKAAAAPPPPDPIVLAAQRDMLANKMLLAQQNADKTKQALESLAPLQFLHFPIPKDGIPSDFTAFNNFLVTLDSLLRAKNNLYVFSMEGHGRTGLLAAILLGRLYGIPSLEALERAQRLHDCQWAMHSVPPTRLTSSPKTTTQITMVQHVLAPIDAIYVPVMSQEDTQDSLFMWRAQQRGVVAASFMNKDGFMISEAPRETIKDDQTSEFLRLQRVAKRESNAVKLQFERKQQALDRVEMTEQDDASHALACWIKRQASLKLMQCALEAVDPEVFSVDSGPSDPEETMRSYECALMAEEDPMRPPEAGPSSRTTSRLILELAMHGCEDQELPHTLTADTREY